ncbi:hypothetical protein DYB28_000498 [Aphanomyces astaci]|uniref:Serine/threonine-protein phosphatase PGAM5, mitochondrial n=1 Tax=Aphanomyces astaci TaxID=112090 RepID=A0A396ZNK5_APHAT|nr:hypothetical protein DYB36_001621 [Aphanomyces astaci]RHY17902.1 hypothetical protein DYB25_006163 [Aphanomyces astaci]RHY64409.1 hypothetical protein DYB34_006378 [Aphanomyces astaci]RHY76903.1 hypothetical protein DYB38_003447 [Aphanomyces astaci]RHY78747.1 hypothetical protein DYB30_007826 [Aphanomyces astaci]
MSHRTRFLHFKSDTVADTLMWLDAFAAIGTPPHAPKKRRVHDTAGVPTHATSATQTAATHTLPTTATASCRSLSPPSSLSSNTYVVTLPSLPPAKVLHIVLVRHGHYVNAHSKHARDSDQVLSHIGRRQAEWAGRHLHHQLVVASSSRHDLVLLHSDMERAVETAGIIGDFFPDCSRTPSPLLREGWPGAPSSNRPPALQNEFDDAPPHDAKERGEQGGRGVSDAAFTSSPSPEAQAIEDRRLDRAFQTTFMVQAPMATSSTSSTSTTLEDEAATVGPTCRVVVCHANVIRYFLCRAMGIVAAGVWGAFEINHCSITRIDVSSTGACKILAVNECGHLPGTLVTSSEDHL